MEKKTATQLNRAPVLIELFRGYDTAKRPLVERVHRGLICAVDGEGNEIFCQGESQTLIHMRSCAKPFQVLPLVESGIFFSEKSHVPSHINLSSLALFISSHAGQKIHTERIQQLLTSMGFCEGDLRCGASMPQDDYAKCQLIATGKKPSALHNCCSGKHAGLLILCKKNGWSINNYECINHPLQQLIKKKIAQIANISESQISYGINGCSLPSFIIPLKNLALMYARLAYWQKNSQLPATDQLSEAFKCIWQAAILNPNLIAGTNCFDSHFVSHGQGIIFCKSGADGLQSISLMPCQKFPKGLGIAIKIADGDGNRTICPLVVKELFTILGIPQKSFNFEKFSLNFKNFRGIHCGGYLNKLENAHQGKK